MASLGGEAAGVSGAEQDKARPRRAALRWRTCDMFMLHRQIYNRPNDRNTAALRKLEIFNHPVGASLLFTQSDRSQL